MRNPFLIFSFVTCMLGSFALHAQDDVVTDDQVIEEMNNYLTHLNGDHAANATKRAEQMKTVKKMRGLWKNREFRKLREMPLETVLNTEDNNPFFVSAIAFHNDSLESYPSDFNKNPSISQDLYAEYTRRAKEFRNSLKGCHSFSKTLTILDTRKPIAEFDNTSNISHYVHIKAIDPNLRFLVITNTPTIKVREKYTAVRNYYAVSSDGKTYFNFLQIKEFFGAGSVAFSPDGLLLGIWEPDNYLAIFDTSDFPPKLIDTFQVDMQYPFWTEIIISQDKKNVFFLCDNKESGVENTIFIFNLEQRKIIHTENVKKYSPLMSFSYGRLTFNPTGPELARLTEEGIQFIDFSQVIGPNPGSSITTLLPNENHASSLLYNSNGTMMVIDNWDTNANVTSLYELPSFNKISEIPEPVRLNSWAFHPQEPLLYSLSGSGILATYDTHTGASVFSQDTNREYDRREYVYHSIHFNKDGQKLAIHHISATETDDTIDLWEALKPDLGLLYLIDPNKVDPHGTSSAEGEKK